MQDISEDLVRELFAGEPEEPVLLITLSADGLDDPIRAASHDGRLAGTTRRGVLSRGEIFDFAPFEFTWAGAGEGEPSRDAKLEMFIRDGDVARAIRTATGQPTVTAEMVRLSEPDVVEMAMTDAEVAEAEIDAPKAIATIRSRDFAAEPACKASYNPSRTPGAY